MSATAVVGVGQSEYSWSSGRPESALAVDAIRSALADAGLSFADVDGVVRCSLESTSASELVSLTGMRPLSFSADDGNGGSFATGLLGLAQAAIATGRARVVVAFRAFNGRSAARMGRPAPSSIGGTETLARARGASPVGGEFAGPYGLVSPAHAFALWARAYMDRYGISDERMAAALGAVSMYQRRNASHNPAALLRDAPLTPADYAASPMIVEPLRRADICLESDGACAIVLAAAEVARGCRRPPVYLLGAVQHILPGYQQLFLMEEQLPPAVPREMVASLLGRCGLSVADIDVLGSYDACSFGVLNDLESVGLCGPGEAVDWVLDPAVPYNTSGGHLAEVYLNGMNQIVEVVRQLQGTAAHQVARAGVGLVCSAGMLSVALLSREMRP